MKAQTRRKIIKLHIAGYEVESMREHDQSLNSMPEVSIRQVIAQYETLEGKDREIKSLCDTVDRLNLKLDELRTTMGLKDVRYLETQSSLNKMCAERGKWIRKIRRLEAKKK